MWGLILGEEDSMRVPMYNIIHYLSASWNLPPEFPQVEPQKNQAYATQSKWEITFGGSFSVCLGPISLTCLDLVWLPLGFGLVWIGFFYFDSFPLTC